MLMYDVFNKENAFLGEYIVFYYYYLDVSVPVKTCLMRLYIRNFQNGGGCKQSGEYCLEL